MLGWLRNEHHRGWRMGCAGWGCRDKGLWDWGAVGAGNAGWGIQVGDVEGIGEVQWVHGKNEGMHDGGCEMAT